MTMLKTSVSAAVLILAIAAIRGFMLHRLPKKTFLALWGVALCRLLIPVSVPSRFSVYTFADTLKDRLTKANTPIVLRNITALPDGWAAPDIASPVLTNMASVNISPATIVWLIGLLACALFFLVTHLRCRTDYKTALPIDSEFVAKWRKEHPTRRNMQIRQSDKIAAPLTYGIFRPVVLLPKTTDWKDEASLEYILTHELVHVRRFDILAKWLLAAALCVHWFNPFVWVMYVLANRDIELSCDETVLRISGETKKSAYALTLIKLEEKKSGLTPLINHFSKYAIEERIKAIMKIKKFSLVGMIFALALVFGTTAVFATHATRAPKENAPADASAALEQLADSISYADGELSFQIPESYPNPKDWSILISGRMEQDGFGMSVHYLTQENESRNWEAGKRYIVPLKGSRKNYTELWLTASLPNENGGEINIDLLETR